MKQYKICGLCVLLSLSLFLGACNKTGDASTTGTNQNTTGASNEKIVVESTSMGKVTFKESSLRNKKMIKVVSGGEVALTDDEGNVWSLYIPPYALRTSTEIELVALTSITGDSLDVPFKGGIQLLPDGLNFVVPVTMTLRTKDGTLEPVPFLGSHDGTNMNFIACHPKSNTMQFDHFSSLVFTDRGSLRTAASRGEIENKALSKTQSDLTFIRKYLKEHKNDVEVPTPPAVSLACECEETAKKSAEQNKKFINDAFEPEGLMLRMLLSDLSAISFLEVETPLETDIKYNISALMNRLSVKASKLMDTYRSQPDYMLPILQFAIKVAKEAEAGNFLGDDVAPAAAKLTAKMPSFMASSLDTILKRLTEEHDYRQGSVALKVASWVSQFGDFDAGGIMKRVQAAMRFNLELSVKYVTADTSYGVAATIPVKLEFASPAAGNLLHGSGTTRLNFSTSVPDTEMSATSLPINVLITEFNPCLGSGYFVISGLYVNNEVMTIDDESIPMPIYQRWWEFAFEAYASKGGSELDFMNTDTLYKFPFTINNLNAETFSESIDGKNNSKGKMTITFEYKMTHS